MIAKYFAIIFIFFKLTSVHAVHPKNDLAVRKPTKATSSYPGSAPSQAVDGRDDSDWSTKSCFAVAESDQYPWWQVDLQGIFIVTEVDVIVRSDCCPERFHDVAVEVYEDDPTITPETTAQLCHWFKDAATKPGGTVSLNCSNAVIGRFVRLSGKAKRNPNDLFQFCEVKVLGTILTTNNLAVRKPTKATSSYPGSAPSQAVDGNDDSDWSTKSCFAVAESDQNPWWQVDLQGIFTVTEVDVIVRSDCCPERFHDVAVEVYEDDPTITPETTAQLCHWFKDAATKPGGTVSLNCSNAVIGRFVRLSGKAKRNPNDLFQFCEVKVLGTILTTNNLAVRKPTKATSSYPGSAPSQAVDGNDDSDWSTKSCFAVAESDQYPWWQVDLQGIFTVTEVDVIVRSDCCPERFHDVAVEVYEDDPTITPETTAQLCHWFKGAATKPGGTVSLKCSNTVKGRFVRLSGKAKRNPNDLFQFCEVKVIGTRSFI